MLGKCIDLPLHSPPVAGLPTTANEQSMVWVRQQLDKLRGWAASTAYKITDVQIRALGLSIVILTRKWSHLELKFTRLKGANKIDII